MPSPGLTSEANHNDVAAKAAPTQAPLAAAFRGRARPTERRTALPTRALDAYTLNDLNKLTT